MNARAHAVPPAFVDARPSRGQWELERNRVQDATGDRLLLGLLGVYLASIAFEGVLRYVLATSGMPNALYLRDIIPVTTITVLLARPLLCDGRIDLATMLAVAALAFHGAWAALLGVPFFSILFGLKIFMFIPYGIAMWPLVRRRLRACMSFASALFALTMLGVLVNQLLGRAPWEGLEYNTAFGQVSSTRLWWISDGVARLPGFARTSFSAAMILGITGLVAVVQSHRMPVRLVTIATALAGILLTTSKGMILAFPLAAAWLLVLEHNSRKTGVIVVGAVALATAAVPLVIIGFDMGLSMNASSFPALLVSVWDRFTGMWPQAFALLPDGPAALLGGGPGAIGMPQLFGDAPHKFNAGDNFPLHMLVTFGLPGLLYYAVPALAVVRVAALEGPTVHVPYVGLLLIAYGYGMSINMVEDSFFAIIFGLCCGIAVSSWTRQPGT